MWCTAAEYANQKAINGWWLGLLFQMSWGKTSSHLRRFLPANIRNNVHKLSSFPPIFVSAHSRLSLDAHLLPPLPPQLHAAVKVIVHDAPKKSLLAFSLKETNIMSWVDEWPLNQLILNLKEPQCCWAFGTLCLDNPPRVLRHYSECRGDSRTRESTTICHRAMPPAQWGLILNNTNSW